LGKKAAFAEMQAQMQTELPAARARLERLIEARAIVLAEEMYKERSVSTARP
jgi:Lon protease-like protein